MTYLIYIGAIMVILGLVGLGYCIRKAMLIKQEQDQTEEVTKRMNGLVAINMASVGVSFLGLALIVIGLIIG